MIQHSIFQSSLGWRRWLMSLQNFFFLLSLWMVTMTMQWWCHRFLVSTTLCQLICDWKVIFRPKPITGCSKPCSIMGNGWNFNARVHYFSIIRVYFQLYWFLSIVYGNPRVHRNPRIRLRDNDAQSCNCWGRIDSNTSYSRRRRRRR